MQLLTHQKSGVADWRLHDMISLASKTNGARKPKGSNTLLTELHGERQSRMCQILRTISCQALSEGGGGFIVVKIESFKLC